MHKYLVMSAERAARFAQIALVHTFRRHEPYFADALGSDPISELTQRVRHPARWRLTHPVQAIGRALRLNA
jgi:hypothetical protein